MERDVGGLERTLTQRLSPTVTIVRLYLLFCPWAPPGRTPEPHGRSTHKLTCAQFSGHGKRTVCEGVRPGSALLSLSHRRFDAEIAERTKQGRAMMHTAAYGHMVVCQPWEGNSPCGTSKRIPYRRMAGVGIR